MDKYWNAIKNWHDKADKADDPFIKFILEYISFIALLNKKIPIVQDRPKIQILKDNNTFKRLYLDSLDGSILNNLMVYLEKEPIINVTNPHDRYWDGKLQSSEDYRSIIEFIYRARNNLFHGHKHLDYNRDLMVVKHAYNVLRPLMNILIQNDDINSILLDINDSTGKNKELICPYCIKKLKTEQGLRQHVSAKHPKDK